jgi:hypothetical protein
MADTYLIHGLRVRSERPLPQEESSGDEAVDVNVGWSGAREIPAGPPEGKLLIQQQLGEWGMAIADRGDGLTVRFARLCEFRLDGDGGIEVSPQPDVGEDVAAALLVASVLPCLLVQRGAALLHASAVLHEGRVVAYAGGAGCGKSMRAAELCAEGAELVTDDVLRIEEVSGGTSCHRGTGRILLHSQDRDLIDRFPPDRRQTTWDGRVAVTPPMVREPVLPLSEVVQLGDDPRQEPWQRLADRLR